MAKGVSRELMRGLLELEPSSLLEFFIIYYNYEENPSEFIAIHAGSNGIGVPIYWQGVKYIPFNIEGSAWEKSNDQKLPRPKIRVSNQGLVVSTLLRKYKDLNGSKVVRKRTLARFLDNRNFPNGQNPYGQENFNAGFADEKYYISHKISETKEEVEFELVTPLELENQKIPNRKVHSLRCGFVYRGYGCRYTGPPVADMDDNLLVESSVNVSTTADLIFKAENDFIDVSKSQLHTKDFSEECTFGTPAFTGVGLYSIGDAGHYPSTGAAQVTPFSDSSFYFDGSGAVCLSTGFTGGEIPQLTHGSGLSQMARTVTFWCYPYSGVDHNPSGDRVLVDFGGVSGGFGVFIGGSGADNTGYLGVIRTSGSGAFDSRIWMIPSGGDSTVFNKWTHVAFAYTMGEEIDQKNWGKLYLNGELKASGKLWTKDETAITLEARQTAISTGANGLGAALDVWANDTDGTTTGIRNGFNGYMEDFRIYNGEMPADFINQIYQYQNISTLTEADLNDRGEWQEGVSYVRGDVVYVEGKRYKMFSNKTDSGFQGIKFKFICVSDTTSDPKTDSVNWKKDACSKSLMGCSFRYGDFLPFGGYPGTHRYPFSARQNGY